jgi:predicted glutamine amidotransferase
VTALSKEISHGATLNFLASNGDNAVAVRYATPGHEAPSLYWRKLIRGVLVASEPLEEDSAWQKIEPNTRLSFRSGELRELRRLGP